MRKSLINILTLVLLVMSVAEAAVDVFEFSSTEQRERYQTLVDELRCPKCQNQNLAGSDSPIAMDLRQELYRQLKDGRTDDQIKAFMVQRYGDYVLYRPPVQSNTLILWWGPPLILAVAVMIALLLVWHRRRLMNRQDSDDEHLSAEEQARLDRLLAQAQASPLQDSDKNDSTG
jgi:cytochrome c-type biogenesis protein CcmH